MAGRIILPGAGPIFRGKQGIFPSGAGRIGGADASLTKAGNAFLNYFMASGAACPWKPPSVSPVHIYNAATNKTWFHYQAQRGPAVAPPISTVQDIRVTTYDHTAKTWGPDYIAATHVITADVHGTPTATRDAAGYGYIFYGAHQSAIRIASTVNPNDPSLWTDTQTYGDTTTIPVTQPKVYHNATNDNIELFCVSKPAGPNLQSALALTPFTPSAGTLTPGTRRVLFDFNTEGFLYYGEWAQVGNNIYMTLMPAQTDYLLIAVYDQATGNISNMDGSVVVTPASQPISDTTAIASFLVRNFVSLGHCTGQHGMLYDGTTVHLVYGEMDDRLADPATHTNVRLQHTYWTGSAWAAAATVYTFQPTATARNVFGTLTLNASGGIDCYFPDFSWPGTGQYSYEIGNMMRATRSPAGVWSAASVFLPATTRGLGVPTSIPNGHPSAAVAFAEESTDALAAVGALKGYVVGNDGGYLRMPIAKPSSLFLARTTGLDAAHTAAYKTLIDGLVSDGVWSSLVMLYVLATQDGATALLNLVSADWKLLPVNSPTFTTDRGYASDGTTSYLDTGGVSAPAGANVWNFVAQNSVSMFGWTMTHSNGTGNQWGAYSGGTAILATPKNTTQMLLRFQRGSGADVTVGMATDIGFFGASRTSSATVDVYENAIQHLGVAQVEQANPNANLWICGTHAASFDTAQVGAVGFGAGMTPAQMTALYNRLHTYMQTIAGVA